MNNRKDNNYQLNNNGNDKNKKSIDKRIILKLIPLYINENNIEFYKNDRNPAISYIYDRKRDILESNLNLNKLNDLVDNFDLKITEGFYLYSCFDNFDNESYLLPHYLLPQLTVVNPKTGKIKNIGSNRINVTYKVLYEDFESKIVGVNRTVSNPNIKIFIYFIKNHYIRLSDNDPDDRELILNIKQRYKLMEELSF